MLIIIVLFLLAAVMGLIMLVQIFRNRKPDKIVAYCHGLFAGTSIILLFFQVIRGAEDKLINLLLFVFVAIIGFYMFYREFYSSRKKTENSSVPRFVVLIHALSAVAAFSLLLINYFA